MSTFRILSFFLFALPTWAQNNAPGIVPGGVVEIASYSHDIAPGSLISVFGHDLAATALSAGLPLPFVLGGTSLEVNDGVTTRQAPLFSVSPGQINAQIPYDIASPNIAVIVRNAMGGSAPEPVTLLDQAPKLFTQPLGVQGEALLFHSDFTSVDSIASAAPGEVLTAYAIGLGAVTPAVTLGAPSGDGLQIPLNRTAQTVSVSVGGLPADVLYAGLAPSSVGLYQVNFQVPAQVTTRLPEITVQSGSRRSQTGLTTSVIRGPSSRDFYVAPNGKPAASGDKSDPWDLATALNQPPAVHAGDVIWMLDGIYGDAGGKTQFTSQLTGTPDNPVMLRQLPGGHATINGGLIVNGSDAWYWGFEVMSTLTVRTGDQYDRGDGALDGVFVNGPRTRFINMVVHDTREGFGFWTPSQDSEIYGCIVFHNGWQAPDRGHGHGIYTQNQNGTKHLGDNIVFNQFGLGIQAYGSAQAFVQGYLVDHNVVFNNGVISRDGRTDNILFGFSGSVSRVRIDSNYTYQTPGADIGDSQVGWSSSAVNKDVTVTGNYWIGGYFALQLWNWDSVVYSGNTNYSQQSANLYLQLAKGQSVAKYNWDNNSYYGSNQFYYLGQPKNWAGWKTGTQLDSNSKFTAGKPTGSWIFVHPNKYEAGRANVVIYNWDLSSKVLVDLSSTLKPGSAYQIRDAQNYFGPVIAAGTYGGGTVAIPMTGLSVVQPIGAVPNPPTHTAPEFGTFVVIQQ
ncbi:MAG: hypothetical protein JWO80_44 [Bryobacterales bacterium]|nr:hypothetical protein [Bryobacterales bacterium]